VSLVSTVVDPILNLHGPPAYALVGALVFSEAALFVGFVLPGETAALLGGVLAHRQQVSLAGMAAVAVAAAIIGDSVGYEVGRHFGTRLVGTRVFARRQQGLVRAQQTLRAKGGRAVFLARFTAFLRAVMPGLAGTARMPYRRFLAFNAAGGIVWGTGVVLLGYLAGTSYAAIERTAGRGVTLAAAGIVLVALAVWRVRAHDDDGGVVTPPGPAVTYCEPPLDTALALITPPAGSPLSPAETTLAGPAGVRR
jgi:membrane protein DedA with SNARE-associated domain